MMLPEIRRLYWCLLLCHESDLPIIGLICGTVKGSVACSMLTATCSLLELFLLVLSGFVF